MDYVVRKAPTPPLLNGNASTGPWDKADTIDIAHFYARSSDHHPRTRARLLYDDQAIYVLFDVQDRYVKAVHPNYQGPVCRDSCVEFFVQPRADKGYLNFEINCGGTMLLYYIEDATRVPTGLGFKKCVAVPEELGRTVQIHHSLPKIVDPEITEPVDWTVAYRIPLKLIEHYTGPLGKLAAQTWRANFYKCADGCSHPHWASWVPVGEPLSFHQPKYFAPIRFED